jgi:predicted dehydrogenase
MTEQQRQIGRRNFLKAAATLPVAGALTWKASGMQPVRAALIGPGSQGRLLIENANPDVLRIVAVADVFPPNLQKGLEVARRIHDPNAEGYADYRQAIERKDVDAVIVAVPLWMHARVTLDALAAGKHVLVEKMMAYTEGECRQMIEAAARGRLTLQVGHQRAYNPLYHEARELLRSGAIGDVFHVRAVWHRNSTWRRPLPAEPFDPTAFGYSDMEHLVNWRMYRKYSQGLLSELACHQVHAVNWLTGKTPTSVMATGGVHRHQDGREVPDHIYAILEYPGNLTMSYSTILSNAYDNYYEQYMGTKGTIVLGGETEALLFAEGASGPATEITITPSAGGPLLEASESRARDAAGSAVGGGSATGWNAMTAYKNQLDGFCRTLRTGYPNFCDGQAGMAATVPIIKAGDALAARARVDIPPLTVT